MKLFNELIGEKLDGVETVDMLNHCHALLLQIRDNEEKETLTRNNNLELSSSINVSQSEAKKAKRILENNGLIEIVKDDSLESFLKLTTKGSFYAANLKTQQLKEAMVGDTELTHDVFIDDSMDVRFVETYNQLSYHERVVYEAIVAATFCRPYYECCLFRTLGSLLDSTANKIMPILSDLEQTGLTKLVGEKSTKIYLTNTREFLMTHYESFYDTGLVENDHIYKESFRYDVYSGYEAPYEFPDFEVVANDTLLTDDEVATPLGESDEPTEEVVVPDPVTATPQPVATNELTGRVFIIDTESVMLEQFLQTAPTILTSNDHYVAMLSATRMGSSMSFTLFNHLMKLPCRGETELVENPTLYPQFCAIQILHAIQTYPTSEIVVVTNDVSYLTVTQHLQAKFNLHPNRIQVMNYSA